MQRWYIDSFRVDGFEALRHECANAAMVVYPSLSHTRSRELFDVTMLEVRRVLYGDFKRREPIIAGRLLGIRSAWMARYAPLMNADEFTKFTVLMRNLAPAVSRKNIELILYGDPDAVPLFK